MFLDEALSHVFGPGEEITEGITLYAPPEPHTPRAADQESNQQHRAKQRTQDRRAARSLKYSSL